MRCMQEVIQCFGVLADNLTLFVSVHNGGYFIERIEDEEKPPLRQDYLKIILQEIENGAVLSSL